MDAAPYTAFRPTTPVHRVLAALGPKMLALAAERTDGAHTYLVPPEHTAGARKELGAGPLLCVEQAVLLETDPARAREIGRAHTAVYVRLPNYQNNLRRLGFTDDGLRRRRQRPTGRHHRGVGRRGDDRATGSEPTSTPAPTTCACRPCAPGPGRCPPSSGGPWPRRCCDWSCRRIVARPGPPRPPDWRRWCDSALRREHRRDRSGQHVEAVGQQPSSMVSGGSSRITLPHVPQVSTTTPWAWQAAAMAAAAAAGRGWSCRAATSSMACMAPRPRTSPMAG